MPECPNCKIRISHILQNSIYSKKLKGGESVAQEMHTLDNLTRVITDSMNEMASGVIEINNAVQEVHEITQKNKRSVEGLANEVSKFKVN